MIKDAKNLTKKQIKEGQTSLPQDDFAPYQNSERGLHPTLGWR